MVDLKFGEAFNGFIKAYSAKLEDYDARKFPASSARFAPLVGVDEGSKYMKVWVSRGPGSKSVYCFVNRENGDILKAASWKAPAKGARGSIYDADNGMSAMGPYGAVYNNGFGIGWA
jgi:hypothetical protein